MSSTTKSILITVVLNKRTDGVHRNEPDGDLRLVATSFPGPCPWLVPPSSQGKGPGNEVGLVGVTGSLAFIGGTVGGTGALLETTLKMVASRGRQLFLVFN